MIHSSVALQCAEKILSISKKKFISRGILVENYTFQINKKENESKNITGDDGFPNGIQFIQV